VDTNTALRDQLSRLLAHSQAHTDFDDVVESLAPDVRGTRPAGLPHSPWELLEHIRIAQRDILDFCLDAPYGKMSWPDDYWPASPEPPSPEAWDGSVAAIHRDRAEFQRLTEDTNVDLVAVVPHGTTQTFLREALLVADHNAYHMGQLTIVSRLLR
jgi:hypothetical protein